MVLVFALFALTALAAVVRLAARAVRLPVAGIAMLALVVLFYGSRTYDYTRVYPTDRWFGARDAVYREIAAHLRAHAAPADVVLSEEVGTIAYYSHRPMYDVIGLVTRGGTWSVLDGGKVGTDRVPGLRWAVFYDFRLPPAAPPPMRVGTGAFQVYLVDLRPLVSPAR